MNPRTHYTIPPEVEKQRRAKAALRRKALMAAGCATYELGFRSGASAIQCLCCGLGSSNASDISERYCGFCREFHAEWREVQPDDPT